MQCRLHHSDCDCKSVNKSGPLPWLTQGIREMGGHTKAAPLLNMETIRRPRGHWWDLGRVVMELREYLHGRPDIWEQRRLPTHK